MLETQIICGMKYSDLIRSQFNFFDQKPNTVHQPEDTVKHGGGTIILRNLLSMVAFLTQPFLTQSLLWGRIVPHSFVSML